MDEDSNTECVPEVEDALSSAESALGSVNDSIRTLTSASSDCCRHDAKNNEVCGCDCHD